MGFLSNLVSSAVKATLTPIAVVKDAVDVATGEEPTTTKDLIQSAVQDMAEAADDLGDGDL